MRAYELVKRQEISKNRREFKASVLEVKQWEQEYKQRQNTQFMKRRDDRRGGSNG